MPTVTAHRALLVDREDPNLASRARLSIPALSISLSDWAKVAFAPAESRPFLPEVGDEVLVSAEAGRYDRRFIFPLSMPSLFDGLTLLRGRVIDTRDPRLAGRVRVEVPALGSATGTDFCPLCRPYTERDWPQVRPGIRVVMSFEGGDVARPVVLGALNAA